MPQRANEKSAMARRASPKVAGGESPRLGPQWDTPRRGGRDLPWIEWNRPDQAWSPQS
jgi:hypothetical protein